MSIPSQNPGFIGRASRLGRNGSWSVSAARAAASAVGLWVLACGQAPGEPGPGTADTDRVEMLPPAARQVEVARGLDIPDSLSCDGVGAVPAEARLLTRVQYENSLRALFPGLPTGVTSNFPAEMKVFFFGTNQEHHRITPLLADAQMQAAEAVVDWVLAQDAVAATCDGLVGADCAARVVDVFGAALFRRPLLEQERAVLLELYQAGQSELETQRGLRVVLEALLQAPQFLYRLEESGAQAQAGESVPLNSYELATRLSFLLHNGPPDAALLQAAQEDALLDPARLEAEARRMLSDERALATLTEFAHQWLGTEVLRSGSLLRVRSDSEEAVELASSWLGSFDAFIAGVFNSTAPSIPSLLASESVYLDEPLAAIHGVTLTPGGPAFQEQRLEPEARAGLLTQPALLAVLSHPDQSSPVHRGVFVLDRLLCEPPAPPPPGLAIVAPDPSPYLTTRERFAVHTQSAACSGCHAYIDPVGFAFEQFDQLGRLRTEENGLAIDASGGIVDTPADALEDYIEGDVSGARELALRLSASAQVQACSAMQWYQFSMGRVQRTEDLCSLIALRDDVLKSNGNLREMMLALVRTDAFRFRLATAQEASDAP